MSTAAQHSTPLLKRARKPAPAHSIPHYAEPSPEYPNTADLNKQPALNAGSCTTKDGGKLGLKRRAMVAVEQFSK